MNSSHSGLQRMYPQKRRSVLRFPQVVNERIIVNALIEKLGAACMVILRGQPDTIRVRSSRTIKKSLNKNDAEATRIQGAGDSHGEAPLILLRSTVSPEEVRERWRNDEFEGSWVDSIQPHWVREKEGVSAELCEVTQVCLRT